MKYMNNRFGQSNIFGNCRMKMPVEVADEGSGSGGGAGTDSGNQTGDGDTNADQSYDELVAALAESRAEAAKQKAEAAKYKNSIDDLTKKNKNLTEQVRARMTAEEQANEERKAQEANKAQELADLKAWKATTIAAKRYRTLEMSEEMANECATAEINGDFEKITENLAKHIKELKKNAGDERMNSFLASRPDIKAGNGDAETNLSIQIAKQLSESKSNRAVSTDILKNFM